MSEKETFRKLSQEEKASNFFTWEILPIIHKISDADIQQFRDREVLPEEQSRFDSYDKETKISIVAIANLTDETLNKLKKFSKTGLDQLHIPCLHKIFGHLRRLCNMTENPKYSSDEK